MGKRTTPPENADYEAFCRRIIRKLGYRCADGDLEDLYILKRLADELAEAEYTAWAGLLDQGYSLNQIAIVLGITRQSAGERYHRMRQRWPHLDDMGER